MPTWARPQEALSTLPKVSLRVLSFTSVALLLVILILRQIGSPSDYYEAEQQASTFAIQDKTNYNMPVADTQAPKSKPQSSWNPVTWSPTAILEDFFPPTKSIPPPPSLMEKLTMLSHDREIRIVITENQSAHDEVVAPLIAAFGSIPGANITAILLSKLDRYGAYEMFRTLHVASDDNPEPNPWPVPKNYRSSDLDEYLLNDPPDILICTTCAFDKFDQYQSLLENTNVHIFCIIHHAEKWTPFFNFDQHEKRLGSWVAADRLDFITLSPHVARIMPSMLQSWKALENKAVLPPIHCLPPVFELDAKPAAAMYDDATLVERQEEEEISLALQGNYEPTRRNFTHVFEGLAEIKGMLAPKAELTTSENDFADSEIGFIPSVSVRLHMVGSGTRPPVPEEVADIVTFDEKLNFTDFYATLSHMSAILPAFADEDYFTLKASSSVPAALIAGAPIIASQKMLASYSYLEEAAAWVIGENQTDFDVIWEVVKAPAWQRDEKVENAKALRKKLAAQAKADAAQWVNDILLRQQQRLEWFGNSTA